MENSENNITTVCDEDKNFIRTLLELPNDKKVLVYGILIGLDLKENPSANSSTS